MKSSRQRQRARSFERGALALLLVMSVGGLSACSGLLDADLPSQLTDGALTDPSGAETQANTIITHFESAYDIHTYRTLGREDAGEVYLCGPMCNVANYITASDAFGPMSIALRFATELHNRLTNDWAPEQVPQRDRLLAMSSLYEGAILGWMGSNLCEIAIDGGPLLAPDEVLQRANTTLTRSLSEINAAGGDFALPNNISPSARTMALGLRAQVRWLAGDYAGASADAEEVPQGFVAYVTREPGIASTSAAVTTRQNRGWFSGSGGAFFEVYDPIDWWSGPPNPVTGEAWPNVIPFTGYTNLGILPDGRAIREDQIPVRTAAGWMNDHGVMAGAVPDTRVRTDTRTIQGKQAQGEVPWKYTEEGADIPLVNWKEMWLIRAEIAGGQTAIDLVNELRSADNLPLVTYADPSNPEEIRDMIFEERRRALFNEARFFYTKLKNLDVLWFPRDAGGTRVQNRRLEGGIRYTMPNSEYVVNVNFSSADRATLCAPAERPINP